jgi:hypothetical protein
LNVAEAEDRQEDKREECNADAEARAFAEILGHIQWKE